MAFVPLKKFIIITIIIAITPYFLAVFVSQSNQGHTARKKIPPRLHCIVVKLLCLNVIRNIIQLPRVYSNYFSAHTLSFKMVRNEKKCCWVVLHYLVAHVRRLKLIRDKSQRVWVVSNCLATHFLGLKAIRGIHQETWLHPSLPRCTTLVS